METTATISFGMLYPDYIQHRKPEINLPYPKCVKSFIYDFYEVFEEEDIPRAYAKCKECAASVYMMRGVDVCSSYTSGLVTHLQKHSRQWNKYLGLLAENITPDTKTPRQHYQSRVNRPVRLNKEESSRRLDISTINYNNNKKNCAGVFYNQRDIEIFKNNVSYEYQNAKMLRYIHPFTNQNVHIFDLVGTQHPSARLDGSYKQSKCLVDNDGNIVVDLERLFCEHVCFFDPEKYGECPNEHEDQGNISIFSDIEYQERFHGFVEEIEKYPEFQVNKTFDTQILEDIDIIEHNKTAILEMNKLLKILLSLLIINKPKIDKKIKKLLEGKIDNDRLQKPILGLQSWGPKFANVDLSIDTDSTVSIPESAFSTFQHLDISDCPAYTDNSMKASNVAHFENGRAWYPCNTGSCLKGCACTPCGDSSVYEEPNSFSCTEHSIDHPEMFNEVEDLSISRRQFVDVETKRAIYRRPVADKKLYPPKIKLAGMKKKCKKCNKVYKDHKRHHHIIHPSCQICGHLVMSSKTSFKLTCYLCFKIFKNKYKLADHMSCHDDENPYSCKICDKSFTTKHSYEKHILSNHSELKEKFECDICDEVFSKRYNLTRHKNDKHTPDKEQFPCDLCERRFKRKDTLLRHERTDHKRIRNQALIPGVNKSSEPYKCFVCTNEFKDKNTLIRHIESLHGDNSFQCNLCFKIFNRNDNLQIHMQSHNYTLPRIICVVCRQEFPSKQELRSHRLQIHDG